MGSGSVFALAMGTIQMNLPPFKISDRIRTKTGEIGRIAVVTFDGSAAYVQLDGTDLSSTLAIYPVSELTRINAESRDTIQKS
jgi:hypothetical protein